MTRQFLKVVAASTMLALTAASTPALADNTVQNLGPVGPNQPILATFGNKQLVASFASGGGACAIQTVVWNADDIDAKSASQFRVRLNPGERTEIDGSANETITLQCGDSAQTLAVVGTTAAIASR